MPPGSVAFSSGFNDGCAIPWDASEDGNLYEDGIAHTVDECQGNADPEAAAPDEEPDDPEGYGDDLGKHDGCIYAFEQVSTTGTLNWGATHQGDDICPLAP
jgi:hypothetical protein